MAVRLTGRESIAGWLYRVVGFCAANVRKTEARRRRYEREAAMPEDAVTAEAQRELLELLAAAPAGLGTGAGARHIFSCRNAPNLAG
jgi:DNA-directed RNA polymerase specialized sigma24 family protein